MAHIVTQMESPEGILERLKALMEEGCWEQAIQFANKYPQQLRSDFETFWSVGWAYYKLARYTEAIPHLERACAMEHQSDHIAHFALGVVRTQTPQMSARDVSQSCDHP